MMIEMLVHVYRAFLRSQSPEEGVWMRGAGGLATGDEPVDRRRQSLPFRFKITLIEFHEMARALPFGGISLAANAESVQHTPLSQRAAPFRHSSER